MKNRKLSSFSVLVLLWMVLTPAQTGALQSTFYQKHLYFPGWGVKYGSFLDVEYGFITWTDPRIDFDFYAFTWSSRIESLVESCITTTPLSEHCNAPSRGHLIYSAEIAPKVIPPLGDYQFNLWVFTQGGLYSSQYNPITVTIGSSYTRKLSTDLPCKTFKMTQSDPKERVNIRLNNQSAIVATYNYRFAEKYLNYSASTTFWEAEFYEGTNLAVSQLIVTLACYTNTCGDGYTLETEQCDIGPGDPTKGCTTDCKKVAGWTCSEDGPTQKMTCSKCGNGKREGTEECDIGTGDPTKGCTTDCKKVAGWTCNEDANLLSTCQNCGNNKREGTEECDNGKAAGCSACTEEAGWTCNEDLNLLSSCVQTVADSCGDGVKLPTEQCDNGNKLGCTNCRIDPGYKCEGGDGATSLCYYVCGDGIRSANEQCDSGNTVGCINCKITLGYSCTGAVGAKSVCSIKCGDGVRASSETCDNGNQTGCSSNCKPDKGYTCTGNTGSPSVCTPICRDGIRTGTEACDSGIYAGCSTCLRPDTGFTCRGDIGTRSICTRV